MVVKVVRRGEALDHYVWLGDTILTNRQQQLDEEIANK